MENAIDFIGGAAYGATSVAVGQPLDSVKTMMQSRHGYEKMSLSQCTAHLWRTEGVRGLYRGGAPLFVGGALFRSAQFGVYEASLKVIRSATGTDVRRVCGIDWQVVVAGCAGGIGRSIVESPFEFVKVRRQVDEPWKIAEIYKGSSATLIRNSFLFSFFVVYMDLMKAYGPADIPPFFVGGMASTLAWLSIWPLDVVKSKVQSGHFERQSYSCVLRATYKDGSLFRGVGPGLARSMFANGCSMAVMVEVKNALTKRSET